MGGLKTIAQPIINSENHWLPNIISPNFGFLAFGDMGTGWKSEYNLIAQMAQNSPQVYPAVILLGDLIYPSAKKALIEPNIIKPFEQLFRKGFRFYPIWGNHDWIEQKALFVKQYFNAPDYYSYQIGPAQFWSVNSNEFDDKQAYWLNNSLFSSKAVWKIVSLHHSPYSSGEVHRSNKNLIKSFCPILAKHKVDLCLSGHNHLYERTNKIDGVTYIVSGGGSASLHKFASSVDYSRAKVESTYHYLRIRGNINSLAIEAVNSENKIFDQALLSKY